MLDGLHLATHQDVYANAELAGQNGMIKIHNLDIFVPCIMQLSEGYPGLLITQSFVKTVIKNHKKQIVTFHKTEILRLTTITGYRKNTSNINLFYIHSKDCYVNLFVPLNCV
jgi:hypothetical protein